MEQNRGRISWIDEYKGFVLLLVCLFHVEQSFKCIDMGMLHLSAFRMSAFFFISGMLFSTRRFSDFKSYAKHKTKVLLLPYIYLSLLFLVLDPVVWNFDLFPRAPKMVVINTRPVIESLGDYLYWNLAKIFAAGKSSIGSGPIWFVFTLYSISLMFFGLQKIAFNNKILIALAAVGCFAGGWAFSRYHFRLPLGIERDLTCLGFFAFGWLCKGIVQNDKNVIPCLTRNLSASRWRIMSAMTTGIVSFVAFVLYAYFEIPDPYFSIMNNDLGKSLLSFFASSLFGIIGLVAAFQLCSRLPAIAPVNIIKGILRNISRNALVILAIHWWILLLIRILFKTEMDRPSVAYLSIPIVIVGLLIAIPLFRCKLYKLLGKEKISIKESLDISVN